MKQVTRSGLILAAAMAVLPLRYAAAQVRVNTDGHAMDANTRVGSGGYNGAGRVDQRGALNNSLIYGNTSGLNYFHGQIRSFDPNTVQANTQTGASDHLSGVASPINPARRETGGPNYTTFYATANYAESRPADTVLTPGGIGIVPSPRVNTLVPNNVGNVGQVPTDSSGRSLLGQPDNGNSRANADPNAAQQPGSPRYDQDNLYSLSPLYGVHAVDPDSGEDSLFRLGADRYRPSFGAARRQASPDDINRMRDELNSGTRDNPADAPQPGDLTNPRANSTDPHVSSDPHVNALDPRVSTGQAGDLRLNAVSNNAGPGKAGALRPVVVNPAEQSKQIAEMIRRRSQGLATDAEETQLRVMAAAAKKREMDLKDRPKTDDTGPLGHKEDDKPIAEKTTLPPVLRPADNGENAKPMVVTSLADGIKAPGLANLMKSAEEQLRHGKFGPAAETYDMAGQVAPNNPFVGLGRSFAELGSGYYAKSAADLTDAVKTEPAVLVGTYDLRGFIGEDRLTFLQKDLTDISHTEKDGRSVVLLAFIGHNTGDDKAAAECLDEAAKRGGYDSTVDEMRKSWGLSKK